MNICLEYLPATVDVNFVLGGRCRTVKLGKACRIAALTLDDLNIRHFVNSFCKRMALAPFRDSDEDILRFCVIPANRVGAGQTVWDALTTMPCESLRVLGRDDRLVECDRLIARVAAEPSREGQAAHTQTLMDYLQTEPAVQVVEENPKLKEVLVAKCKELRSLHSTEFPALAASCTAVLLHLSDDERVLAALKKLNRRPIRITLQMTGFVAEEGLLWPLDHMVWTSRYGTCVSIYRQFNRYKKANGITASYTFAEMLRCYSPDGKRSLYDILLNWTEAEASLLTPCTVDEFLEPLPEVSELADLRRRIERLEDAEKKRARLIATD